MDKEIILYNFDTGKNEKFVVRPGKKLIFEYTLGTAFEYKINDDNKFSDYIDLISLVDSRGNEHREYVKQTVLSGDMCLPPVINSRANAGYSGNSNSKSRDNGGYSNSYSDPDDFDEDYGESFMDYRNSKYTKDDEYDGYECGVNDEDE